MGDMDQTTQMLVLILVCAFIALFILLIVYMFLKSKDKKKETKEEEINTNSKGSSDKKANVQQFNKKSVFDFMEFDKIKKWKKIYNGN